LLTLAVFVTHQRRTAAPALNLDLFRIRNFTWSNLAMLSFGIAFSALFFGSILFLTNVWGWSILQAGFGVAPAPALVGSSLRAASAGRIGARPTSSPAGFYALSGAYRLAAKRGELLRRPPHRWCSPCLLFPATVQCRCPGTHRTGSVPAVRL
jgi:hypothetical protein